MKIKSFKDYINESTREPFNIGLARAIVKLASKKGFMNIEKGINEEKGLYALTFNFKTPKDSINAINSVQKLQPSLDITNYSKRIFSGIYEYPLDKEKGGRVIVILEDDMEKNVKNYDIDIKDLKNYIKVYESLDKIQYRYPETTPLGTKYVLKDYSYLLIDNNPSEKRIGYYTKDGEFISVFRNINLALKYLEQSGLNESKNIPKEIQDLYSFYKTYYIDKKNKETSKKFLDVNKIEQELKKYYDISTLNKD